MKRDHLIGLWLSKPLYDHIDTQAAEAEVSRPEAIRQILLNEFINTHAASRGLSKQQYITHLIEGGQLDQKLMEELINNMEVTDGQHQHSS